ncbi:hypothetical protein N7493_010046 [Penicillium malachiteum]|uniref:Uncharacterized protein n=1 Tax=Penicillium malachiteum TaxID=1324776 RepID=A0AAD6HE58_9EURO|nr:hypothetical protein N7493_010046 [Penicillium malachiteum]
MPTTMHILCMLNVEGAPGVFEFKPSDGYNPYGSRKLAAMISVAEFPDSVNQWSMRVVIYSTPIRNLDRSWNCQNWVGDALEQLGAAGYLTAVQRESAYHQMIRVVMQARDGSSA